MKDKINEIIDFIDDLTDGVLVDKILGWLLIAIISISMISGIGFCIWFPYTLITRDPTQIKTEKLIKDSDVEYKFIETQEWKTGILIDEYSRNDIIVPFFSGNVRTFIRMPDEYRLTVKYQDDSNKVVTEELDVDAELWEKYQNMIGSEIPVMVYKKYLNDELTNIKIMDIK